MQEEFAGKSLPPELEDSLPKNLSETFDIVRSGVRQSSDHYIGLCNLLERLTKRNQGVAADYLRFSQALSNLLEASQSTYATDTDDVPILNEGISSTARHMTMSQNLLEDEARAWDEGVLEDFKKQRDTLVSIRDMFDRRDRYAKNNIPQLERRIEANENKLAGIMAGAGGKPGEQEKLELAVKAVRITTLYSVNHPLTQEAGQAVDCRPARSWSLYQGVHTRRVGLFSAVAVSREQDASGLESGESQVRGVAG